LLRAGKPVDAEKVFREDLTNNPGNGRSLFGLAEALKMQDKRDDSAAVLSKFKKAWARADVAVTVAGL
jgi:TolA-binding protein